MRTHAAIATLLCLITLHAEAAQLCPRVPNGSTASQGHHLPDSEFAPAKGLQALSDLEKYTNRMADCKSDCYDFNAVLDVLIAQGSLLRLKALAAAPRDKAATMKEYCDFLAKATVAE